MDQVLESIFLHSNEAAFGISFFCGKGMTAAFTRIFACLCVFSPGWYCHTGVTFTMSNCVASYNGGGHYGGCGYHYSYGGGTYTDCTFRWNTAFHEVGF
jgi:hypothetical protein